MVRHGHRMPTQQAALKLVRDGHTYQEAGQRLGVPPGLVHLAATGVPTDSSDGLTAEDMARPGLLPTAQSLSEPRTEAADRSAHVLAFLSARASADAQMQSAARSQQHR